ncbi:MAG: hypothetical protein O3C65_03590 [Proteobacteria bacterium]|nr:hypothetical protein [Pseudomonadota bacterium]MDA1057747.1 hypothetical protein [Pseudomonadota bacterium]
MSSLGMVFLGLVLAGFAFFGILLATLEVTERRKLGYRSGPEPLRHPPAVRYAANDAQVQKAA